MLVLAVIVGALLGGASGEAFGAGVGALLAWLLVRVHQQTRRLGALERTVERLQAGTVAAPVVAAEVAPVAEVDEPVAAPVDEPLPTPFATAAGPAPDTLPHAPLPWDSPAPKSESVPVELPAWVGAIRSWFFGGNTIVKAGVGILFMGLAFLAKYASEQVEVPVEMRLAGIGLVALVLLGLGWRLRLKRPGYAQVLQGGAVGVLYLTLFVAFRFYGVLAAGPVFGAMVCVAALAAALAVLQDARALAVIGALGGFAAPLLVSTGSGNPVALFSYYLVLDLGIAAVAWHKTWRLLNLIGFVFTFAVGSAWGVMRYQPEHLLSSEAFLVAYFLLFNAILLMPARLSTRDDGDDTAAPARDGWVNGSLLFGLPTITFALQHGLVGHLRYGDALSALALAAFYVAMATVMRRQMQRNVGLAITFEASLAIAIVFLTLVIPFALDARSTAGAWALEGAGLVWLGFRQARRLPRAFGYALLVFAGFAMMWAVQSQGDPGTVFNAFLFNGLMAAAGSLAAANFVHRAMKASPHDQAASDPPRGEAAAQPLLIAWATLWLVCTAGMHIDLFVPADFRIAAWLLCISAIALLCTALSTRLDWPMVAAPVLAHAPALALGVVGSAAAFDSPADHGGWWAWPLALATHGVVLWRAAARWPQAAQHAVHVLGVLVLAALGALQGRAVTAGWGADDSAWPWLGWLVVPALLLGLLLRPGTALLWPVRMQPPAYARSAAAVLTVGLLLWTLLANTASNGTASPLPYVPLVNPLDIGIAIALLAAAGWLRSGWARDAMTAQPGLAQPGLAPPHLPAAVLGVCAFVWLNAMLIRAFFHFGGVPFHVEAWAGSLAVQTGITLLWTITALVMMWLSAHRSQRLPWVVGAALLAAVVLKLLLVDLSGSGTVTRIVSFIGVGALMLVIGYVAPLPAKGVRHAPA